MSDAPVVGLYESVLTIRLQQLLATLPADVSSDSELANAEAADRLSRHVSGLVSRAIEALPERERAQRAVALVTGLIDHLRDIDGLQNLGLGDETPLPSARVLHEILQRLPDGSTQSLTRPLTPLLDTTVLTNARGEPALAHEITAEIPSAERVDVLMAFVRFSGIRGMLGPLRRLCESGRQVRLLTTTYTNSTEQRALDELQRIGAEVRVSYDLSITRLHAKAWLFHRGTGFSTAYLGSSNLTHSAQVTGLEWNVRLSAARNPDAVDKMTAVFETYWASRDFVPYDAEEFQRRTAVTSSEPTVLLTDVEIILRPFQEELLERLELARHQGHHANLLVAATGTGKTVMAAVDYARLKSSMTRSRLLFVAHQEEILTKSRGTFAQALRDASFGELWVGGFRPTQFEHVFASIQSLSAAGLENLAPDHFDVVIIDEFHHAAASSYERLLDHLRPIELLGLTATPERSDGLDVLRRFDGRIAAELRLWDAIDQQYLVPFDYFGIYDGVDLTGVPWKRGQGYDTSALTNVLTGDRVWVNRVLEQVRQKVADPTRMRAIGFCVGVEHARFMAAVFAEHGVRAVAIWGDSPRGDREQALRDLASGRVQVVFTVDLFNEGVDVPQVDTLLMLRPTESPTLFLQQLGRGLRRDASKSVCTVLDFVGSHRKEFRYDRRFRALLGGSRKDVESQIENHFPFLPAGCSLQLDAVAQDVVLNSIRNALPTRWPAKVEELRSLSDVSLAAFLDESGLDVADVYANNRSWSELRRAAGMPTAAPGPHEGALLRGVGRLLHIDDTLRLDSYSALLRSASDPGESVLSLLESRAQGMLLGSFPSLTTLEDRRAAMTMLRAHPQVRAELLELLEFLRGRIHHLGGALTLADVPLRLHARYTRNEIQAALGEGDGLRTPSWREGVLYARAAQTDAFVFTLDKSSGGFSPTTRYRDYAISRDLIHWESQGRTSVQSDTGQRYIHHADQGSRILLFARASAEERAFWCLGTASYVQHEGDRPIAFTWRLDHPLPADLYTSFAAAVA